MGAIDYNLENIISLKGLLTLNSEGRLPSRYIITETLKKYADYTIIYKDIEPDIYKICDINKEKIN
tara:strand:- start:149 stop:346 length:198 start_codon:yes stop_codon:yes gene_type:complete